MLLLFRYAETVMINASHCLVLVIGVSFKRQIRMNPNNPMHCVQLLGFESDIKVKSIFKATLQINIWMVQIGSRINLIFTVVLKINFHFAVYMSQGPGMSNIYNHWIFFYLVIYTFLQFKYNIMQKNEVLLHGFLCKSKTIDTTCLSVSVTCMFNTFFQKIKS